MISLMAKSAASTINIFSLFSGQRFPFSSVTGVSTKTNFSTVVAFGSGETTALLKSDITSSSEFFSIASNSFAETPFSSKRLFNFGVGSF